MKFITRAKCVQIHHIQKNKIFVFVIVLKEISKYEMFIFLSVFSSFITKVEKVSHWFECRQRLWNCVFWLILVLFSRLQVTWEKHLTWFFWLTFQTQWEFVEMLVCPSFILSNSMWNVTNDWLVQLQAVFKAELCTVNTGCVCYVVVRMNVSWLHVGYMCLPVCSSSINE